MQTIVVGVEASERADDAIALARRLGPGSRLLLVRVYPGDPLLAGEGGEEYVRAVRAEAETTLARLSGAPGTDILAVAERHPARGLQRAAARAGASLIVVGSSHTGRLRRVLPGSTGEHLLHGTPCPVAIAPRGYRDRADEPFDVVACAYDGAPEARRALAAAEGIARRVGAELRVIRVVDPADPDADLRSVVADVDPDVRVQPIVLRGDAVEELVRASSRVDLLVTGARGYGPLRGVLVGAVSGRLIRGAACPVMVIPRAVRADGNDDRALVPAGAARQSEQEQR